MLIYIYIYIYIYTYRQPAPPAQTLGPQQGSPYTTSFDVGSRSWKVTRNSDGVSKAFPFKGVRPVVVAGEDGSEDIILDPHGNFMITCDELLDGVGLSAPTQTF